MSPYFAYNYVVKHGIDNEYLKLRPDAKKLYGELSFKMERVEGIYHEDESLWEEFPFANALVPLPVHHPQVRVLPYLNLPNGSTGETELGLVYTDQGYRKLASFVLRHYGKFQFPFINDYKLFSLPLFKKYILGKSNKEIWKDLFTKDLTTTFIIRKHFKNRGLGAYLGDLYEVSYRDLVYSLFIYYLRTELLKDRFSESRFFEDRNLGVVYQAPLKDGAFQKESIFILHKGEIYTLELLSKVNSIMAESLRVRLLKNISYVESSEILSKEIYSKYKNISYNDRIGNLGMMYLFTAWSHVQGNKQFFKEMIYFLERGKNNSVPLQTLYSFAYKKFGSNFSQIAGQRQESFEEKMKRLKAESLEAEIEAERNKKVRYDSDNFQSDEERRDFYLQKAKDDQSEKKSEEGDKEYLTD